MRQVAIASVAVCGLAWSTAGATGTQAWAEHQRAVIETCKLASKLQNPAIVGQPVEFDDSVGYTAALIEGRWPQAHMKNRKARLLCLYHRPTRSAHTADADAFLAALGK